MTLQLLLVEDKDRTAQQILSILAETPFEVTRAKDGLGGLNQAKKSLYDVVLIDHKMPLMDGLTLLKNLRDVKGYEQTPLLFMTTDDPRQIADKAVKLGADAVLAKPVEQHMLLTEIQRLAPRHVA
ncbi:response regulator [Aliidiomarina maris]|uniref:Two-component system chemotaxis response regulator CheY n=1 Tax=Aliidiomarina maris TaxID=531312 RepID=A0A327X867_9GAMM|nr:response regulator [Aliidiomarina maris]MBA3988981.1 two-component system response regulator [Idiomarina sp.]MCL5051213.1 response regulator [Bacillota bacterium]RAK01842.1 two-component system chemotaxis response regulator CheY [Aliidiomarina maris]RUO28651.1 two-component system response regulator [Aliidiomarina maris]